MALFYKQLVLILKSDLAVLPGNTCHSSGVHAESDNESTSQGLIGLGHASVL